MQNEEIEKSQIKQSEKLGNISVNCLAAEFGSKFCARCKEENCVCKKKKIHKDKP